MLQPRDVVPPPSAAARDRGSPLPGKIHNDNRMGRRVLGPGRALSAVKARTTAMVGSISPSTSTVSLNSTFSESTFPGETPNGLMMDSSPAAVGGRAGTMLCPICSEHMVCTDKVQFTRRD